MNAIRSYLDNMFRNLPNTQEVRKAKAELLQMMEDKFEELKAEGKTENEAVGIVISEFGNLEEVSSSLGIQEEVRNNVPDDKPMLSMDRIREYLSAVSTRSLLIPLGVFLCIMSVTAPIAGDIAGSGLSETFGVIGMFLMIAAAVVLFIFSGSKNNDFAEINNDRSSLGIEAADYVRNERRRFKPTYSLMVSIGVALCILSVTGPIAIDAIPSANDDIGGILFFLLVALGVFLIVSANVRMNGYDRLLNLNGAGRMSEEFIPKEDRPVNKAPIIICIIAVVLIVGTSLTIRLVRFFGADTSKVTKEYSFDIDSGKSSDIDIKADLTACGIELRSDEEVSVIEVVYSGSGDLSPDIFLEDGDIHIAQDISGRSHVHLFNIDEVRNSPTVVITVPADVTLGDISVEADAGNLEIRDIDMESLTGDFDAGNIDIRNSRAGRLDINADAGNIEIKNSSFTYVTLDTDAGNIEYDDSVFTNADIRSDFGNIEISGLGDLDSYTIDAACDAGYVEVGGQQSGRSYRQSGTGDGSLTVTVNAGNIEIDR